MSDIWRKETNKQTRIVREKQRKRDRQTGIQTERMRKTDIHKRREKRTDSE